MLQYADDGSVYDDGSPSLPGAAPVQITVTPQSKLPIDYGDNGINYNPNWINLDNSQFDQTAFDTAASRIKGSTLRANKLPVNDDRFSLLPSENPTYMMQPDLQNTQAGDVPLPPGAALNDAGQPYWTATGEPVPVVPRPGLLPFARTPEGIKLAMPKMLDLASNIVGGGVAAKVPVKAGEMVLGSGAVRTATEANKAVVNDLGLYSQLERSVKDAKIEKADASQWLGYLKNQPGVKAEEINTVLKELPAGQISKSELENIVNQNKVELKEKVLGGETSDLYKQRDNLQAQLRNEKDLNKRTDLVIEIEKINRKLNDNLGDRSVTQYHQYQLPGGENYQETLLKLPSKNDNRTPLQTAKDLFGDDVKIYDLNNEQTKLLQKEIDKQVEQGKHLYRAPHFGDDGTNLLAHIRYNDRTIEGNKSLHIEEVQSDWHQAGRKNGYKLSESQKKELDAIDNKLTNGLSEKDIGNPDIDTVLKSAVEQKIVSPEEARNYKEYSKGENSNVPDAPFKKNWDEVALKHMIHKAASEGYDAVSWTPGEAQAARYDLSKQVDAIRANKNPNGTYQIGTQLPGHNMARPMREHMEISADKLPDIVGKELAEKIIKGEGGKADEYGRVYSGIDLKVGGEGMKAFYDKMLVNRANDIGKKYGSKVEQRELNKPSFNEWLKNNNQLSKKDAEIEYEKLKGPPIHYFQISDALRNKAVNEGFSMFSSSPVLVPVSHDPWENRKNIKLVPISGNPFQSSVGK